PFRDEVAEPAGEPCRTRRSARSVDRQGAPAATAEEDCARHGFERKPDLRRAGRQRLQRPLWLHLLSSAVRVQPARGGRALRPAAGQRAQRRRLARGAGAGGRPLPRYRETTLFPGRAAFANPEMYEFLEAERIGYTIRLPANDVLQRRIGYLLKRPVGRPPHEERRHYASFSYQAQSWSKPRRVVAKVEWHPGELYPRVGFMAPNLPRPAGAVAAFSNQRGTAGQWIKEGRGAIRWTRLSCRPFAANAVRLQLHTLAMPEAAEPVCARS